MVSKKIKYGAIICFFLFFFLGPYWILLTHFSLSIETSKQELSIVIYNTLFQAVGSGLVSLIFGVLGGLGLLWLSRVMSHQSYYWVESMILLPNLLPSLFVILSCLGLLAPFPFGKGGVILIHSLINVGLVSILFRRIALVKLGRIGDLSLVEGAGFWQFFKTGILGYLKIELLFLFLFVFSSSMMSFNVPYMIGGPSGATLEVLIFEKLMIHQNWSEALGLSLIQMLLIGCVSFLSHQWHEDWDNRPSRTILELIEWKWGLIFPLLAVGIVFYSPLRSIPNGLRQLEALNFSMMELLDPIYKSFQLGFWGGVILLIFSLLACLTYEAPLLKIFSHVYVSPGPVLLGFAFFLIQPKLSSFFMERDQQLNEFLIVLGLAILFFWPLFRLALAAPLKNLQNQIQVAQVLGASPYAILTRVLFPQIVPQVAFLCGIGSMWICGDFALSKMMSSGDYHLAPMIKSLASSYRLDAAQLLMLILCVLSLALFTFWWRLGHVFSRKFKL